MKTRQTKFLVNVVNLWFPNTSESTVYEVSLGENLHKQDSGDTPRSST